VIKTQADIDELHGTESKRGVYCVLVMDGGKTSNADIRHNYVLESSLLSRVRTIQSHIRVYIKVPCHAQGYVQTAKRTQELFRQGLVMLRIPHRLPTPIRDPSPIFCSIPIRI
jgi:hypothetical protein